MNPQLDQVIKQIREWKRPNSTNARRLLSTLTPPDLYDGLDEALEALQDYIDIDRGDYEDADVYASARTDAWDTFIDMLDDIELIDSDNDK